MAANGIRQHTSRLPAETFVVAFVKNCVPMQMPPANDFINRRRHRTKHTMSQNTTDIIVKTRADADACRATGQNYTASRFDDLIDEITELRNRNANQAVTIHEHQQACVAAGLDPLLGCGKCITAQADIITRLRNDKRLLLAAFRAAAARYANDDEGESTRLHRLWEEAVFNVERSPTAMKDEPEGGGA